MAGYVFNSAGSVVTGQNITLNPPVPASTQAGDLLLLFTYEFFGTDSPPSIPGWTVLSPLSADLQSIVYGRIATGSDTASFTWGNIYQTAWIVDYGGLVPTTLTGIVLLSTDHSTSTTNTTQTSSSVVTPPMNNCLVIAAGSRNKTSTVDGCTWGVFSGGPFVQRQSSVPNGPVATGTFQDWIQTTATAVSANNIATISLTDSTQAAKGSILVLAPGTVLTKQPYYDSVQEWG